MLPGSQKRKPRNSSKVNLFISLTFHGLLVLSVLYFAAHEGYLGNKIRTLTVILPEKKVEKPKEPEKQPEKPPEPEPPKVVQTPKPETPKPVTQAPPPAATSQAPPSIAPPPSETVPFYLPTGPTVQSSSDPVEIYRGLLQYALQSRWDRPQDMEDETFVAEMEIAVDPAGQISDPVWKKKTNVKRWDDSVQQAIAKTRSMSRPPPTNFPSRVVVRFDVVPEAPVGP